LTHLSKNAVHWIFNKGQRRLQLPKDTFSAPTGKINTNVNNFRQENYVGPNSITKSKPNKRHSSSLQKRLIQSFNKVTKEEQKSQTNTSKAQNSDPKSESNAPIIHHETFKGKIHPTKIHPLQDKGWEILKTKKLPCKIQK
jgi:hypothetical protein